VLSSYVRAPDRQPLLAPNQNQGEGISIDSYLCTYLAKIEGRSGRQRVADMLFRYQLSRREKASVLQDEIATARSTFSNLWRSHIMTQISKIRYTTPSARARKIRPQPVTAMLHILFYEPLFLEERL